jgi:hypothetical protein
MSHKIRPTSSFGLGSTKAGNNTFSKNHFASSEELSPEVKSKIASLGLERVAGNIYSCPSSQEFWRVSGGKVIKLVGSGVVDNHESITPSDENDPSFSLKGFLEDLDGEF